MILDARLAVPFIHFGFNRTTFLQKQAGKPLRVYIDGNFNKDVYSFNFISSGATITEVTPREFIFEYASAGMKPITLEITNTQTSEVVTSNEIETEQLTYTFDSEELTFDNSIITFDNEQ